MWLTITFNYKETLNKSSKNLSHGVSPRKEIAPWCSGHKPKVLFYYTVKLMMCGKILTDFKHHTDVETKEGRE